MASEPPVNSSGDGQPSTVSVSNEGVSPLLTIQFVFNFFLHLRCMYVEALNSRREGAIFLNFCFTGLPDEVSQPADIPAVDPMCSVYDVEPEMQGGPSSRVLFLGRETTSFLKCAARWFFPCNVSSRLFFFLHWFIPMSKLVEYTDTNLPAPSCRTAQFAADPLASAPASPFPGEKAPSPTSSPLLRPDRPSPPAPGSPASPRPRPPRPAPRRLSVGLPPSAASRARGLLRPFALPRSSSEGGVGGVGVGRAVGRGGWWWNSISHCRRIAQIVTLYGNLG